MTKKIPNVKSSHNETIDQIESWFILFSILVLPIIAAIILPRFIGDFLALVASFVIMLGLAWFWWKRVGSKTPRETQLVFGFVLAFAIVYQSVYRDQNQAEAMVAIGTLTLAIVTFLTLQQSIKQAEISRKQTDIMRQQQLNGAAPVVALNLVGGVGGDVRPGTVRTVLSLTYKNVGKGPALNFRCWLEDTDRPELRCCESGFSQTVLPVSLEGESCEGFIIIEAPRYFLGASLVRAQYESVFGVTYESTLSKPSDSSYNLKYGEAIEVVQLHGKTGNDIEAPSIYEKRGMLDL